MVCQNCHTQQLYESQNKTQYKTQEAGMTEFLRGLWLKTLILLVQVEN